VRQTGSRLYGVHRVVGDEALPRTLKQLSETPKNFGGMLQKIDCVRTLAMAAPALGRLAPVQDSVPRTGVLEGNAEPMLADENTVPTSFWTCTVQLIASPWLLFT
jgi:hypothetical protein